MAGRMQENHVPGKITNSSGKNQSPIFVWYGKNRIENWKIRGVHSKVIS
jgi:hypothetical protein